MNLKKLSGKLPNDDRLITSMAIIMAGLRDVSRKNQFLPGTIRPGRFAQKTERDGSRKKTGTFRSKSNLEVDSPIFVINKLIDTISVLLCK